MSAISVGYRIGNDVRLPDWLMKMNLSTGVKLTYNVLATCSGGREQAWPGQEYLANRVSVSVRSIQRYLGELVRHGLIAISKEIFKGKRRCVYTFLQPGHDPGKEGDKLSPPSVQKADTTEESTTECRLESDKLSPSLNKEESIKGIEFIPPTPQTPEPQANLTFNAGISTGECAEIEKGGEKKAPEDPIWSQVKEHLRVELGEDIVRTWMEPLRFQRREQSVILQAPNSFFLKWLKEHYADGLRNAFQAIGTDIRLELEEITPEERISRQRLLESTQSAATAVKTTPEEPNWSEMTQEEQYLKIYEAYPRSEKFSEGLTVFKRLVKQGVCPASGKLFQAIAKQKKTANWQREEGRFVPQIPKWLAEHRWLDALC